LRRTDRRGHPVFDRDAGPRTYIPRPLTEDELSQRYVALDSLIEALERLTGDDPNEDVPPDLLVDAAPTRSGRRRGAL